MRNNNCKLIRRELDELMLGEAWSSASCREFHEQQTKLRQIVGSLSTVEAPADFDFRLRARLANDGNSAAGIYWTFVRRGLAVAAMVIVFATGAIVVRNVLNQPAGVDDLAQRPEVQQPVKSDQTPPAVKEERTPVPVVEGVGNNPAVAIRKNRPAPIEYKKRPASSMDFSSKGAEVMRVGEPAGMSAAFSIDASLQSFKVSLADGRGNAKTISVPTISFGSERIVPGGNQFAPKRDW
jgi:hypothetical protein